MSGLVIVFESLSSRLSLYQTTPKIEIFENNGYPTIKLLKNYFEIRAIDSSEFRKFQYSELKELKLVNPKDKWLYKLYISISTAGLIFSENDPIKLKVINRNNGDWEYQTSSKYNPEFNKMIMK